MPDSSLTAHREDKTACLLGFGHHQRIREQEQVSVLSLHPGPELNMSVEKERPAGAGEEGLDERAGLRTHRKQEALSGTATR